MRTASSNSPSATIKFSGRILVVDDSPDSLKLVDFHLRRAGAQVIVAHDGAQALQGLVGGATMRSSSSQLQFDLVLLDMQMPDISGLETIRALRARGFLTPVVAFTGSTEPGYREQCLAAGCNDFVAKPLDPQILIAACSPFLTRQAA